MKTFQYVVEVCMFQYVVVLEVMFANLYPSHLQEQ